MVQSLSIHAHKSETHVNTEIIFDDRKFGSPGPVRVGCAWAGRVGPVRVLDRVLSAVLASSPLCNPAEPRSSPATRATQEPAERAKQPPKQAAAAAPGEAQQQQKQPTSTFNATVYIPSSPGGANICNLEPGAAPGAVGPIV